MQCRPDCLKDVFVCSSEDHLYKLYFEPKMKEPILWSSIEDVLTESLQVVLKHLQAKYSEDKNAMIYFTINQDNLTTGIRASVHFLNQNSIYTMLSSVMSTFHHYINSNQSVELNRTFEVFFKILSGVHYEHTKHRRTAVPLRSVVGSWPEDNNQSREKGGLINLPNLSGIDSFFTNQCVLLCFIYLYLKISRPSEHKLFKQLLSQRVTMAQLRKYTPKIKSYIEDFCFLTNEATEGPRELERTAKLYVTHHRCQIIVIRSMDGSNPDIFMAPPQLNFNLPRMYFYLRDNHLLIIDKLQAFFRHFKRRICFGCKRFFSYWNTPKIHRCPQIKCCSLCYGILEQSGFLSCPSERLTFCDSSDLSVNFRHIVCRDRCQNVFKTKKCFDNHWRRCKQNDMPFYCVKCKSMVSRAGRPLAQVVREHVCGVRISKCNVCFQYATAVHDCPILKAAKMKDWPILGTVCMLFKGHAGSENCDECYQLKLEFGKNKNLSLQALCKHPQFNSILCNYHLEARSNNICANAICVWVETARFFFEQKVFLNDSIKSTVIPHHTLHIYSTNPLPFPSCKTKGLSDHLKKILTSTYCSAEKKFFQYLISGQCSNVCFLVENDKMMLKLLDIFLSFQIQPTVIQKGLKIFALEITQIAVKFLNFNNYVAGDLGDWLNQFGIKTLLPFLPQKLNVDKHLASNEPINVDFSLFHEFGDTQASIQRKRDYFDSLSQPINVSDALLNCLKSRCALLLQIVTSYLKQCFVIQKLIADISANSEQEPIHPFGSHVISNPSFVMQIFQFYYLNNFDVCTVRNPYNSLPCTVSSGEFEYTSFLAWKHPDRIIKNAFTSATGDLNFNKVTVDAYSQADKTAIQYYGCWIHKHSRAECLNKRLVETNPELCHRKRTVDQQVNESLLSKFPRQISKVEIMWECVWEQFKKDNPQEIAKFWLESRLPKSRNLVRLNPRASVRGGFLELYKLKALASESKEITFVDCNSLYSYIALDCNLPLGGYHTLHYQDLLDQISLRDGQFYYKNESMQCDIAHVEILAPSNLKRPFLSFRVNDEYSFMANCHKCARLKLTKPCRHNSQDRSFQSTWTCRELAYACSTLNYQIVHWYEVHHYRHFKPVLSDFVKIFASEKLKSSNVLSGLSTQSERQLFCDDVNQRMQFQNDQLKLTPQNCCDNVASKNYFKNCLNSLFGRFSLHSEQLRHVFCKSLHDIQVIVSNPSNTVVDLFSVNDDIIELVYVNRPTVQANRRSNLYFTAIINAQARIFIYDLSKKLSELGCEILTIDTDAICFVHDKNVAFPFDVGVSFGQFKHVLGPGNKIDAFYSLGVRSYIIAYTDENGKQNFITKIKGMSLTSHNNCDIITPDVISNFIEKRFSNEVESVYVPQSRAYINKQTKSFSNLISAHEYSNELHVRRFILPKDKTFQTYSFGYDFKQLNSAM